MEKFIKGYDIVKAALTTAVVAAEDPVAYQIQLLNCITDISASEDDLIKAALVIENVVTNPNQNKVIFNHIAYNSYDKKLVAHGNAPNNIIIDLLNNNPETWNSLPDNPKFAKFLSEAEQPVKKSKKITVRFVDQIDVLKSRFYFEYDIKPRQEMLELLQFHTDPEFSRLARFYLGKITANTPPAP